MLFAYARMMRVGVVLVIMLVAVALGLGGNAYACASKAGDPSFFALQAADTPSNCVSVAPQANNVAATVSPARPAAAALVVVNGLPCCSFNGPASSCGSAACTACLATIAAQNPTLAAPMAALAPIVAANLPLAARDLIPDLPPPRFA
jgi:hypothetical protein